MGFNFKSKDKLAELLLILIIFLLLLTIFFINSKSFETKDKFITFQKIHYLMTEFKNKTKEDNLDMLAKFKNISNFKEIKSNRSYKSEKVERNNNIRNRSFMLNRLQESFKVNDQLNTKSFSQEGEKKNINNLDKLRTALILYLIDHYKLPDSLDELVGEYLTNIPKEYFSQSNKVVMRLDFTGGWYYKSAPVINSNLLKLVEKSLKINISSGYNYNFDFKPYSILIDKSKNRLFLLRGDIILKSYSVAIGDALTPTPVGSFRIKNKLKLQGEQQNTYGAYWIGIDLWTKGGGYGIHGIVDNKINITKQYSKGCIRMEDKDLKQLYELIPINTKVKIK